MTKIIPIESWDQSPGLLDEVVRVVRQGGLVVLPTDTVYGLGAAASHPEACQRIFQIKGRPMEKRLPLLVASREMAMPLVANLKSQAISLMDRFWPGPLTLICHASDRGGDLVQGAQTIALRMPDHPVALELIEHLGVPMAVTSANVSGLRPHVDGKTVALIFDGKVEAIIDGGLCPGKKESTVLDVSCWPPRITRQGALSRETLGI